MAPSAAARYDYIGYVSLLREKGWGAIGVRHDRHQVGVPDRRQTMAIDTSAANLQRARTWLRATKIDAAALFGSVVVFTSCFVILGAVILHPQHLVPDGNALMNHQAQFLTRIHPALHWVVRDGHLRGDWRHGLRRL